MHDWIAFFRGINVGGRNILPMKMLTGLLEKLECEDVKTYIQSGNVVFRHRERDARKLAHRISNAVAANHDFEPQVLLMTAAELAASAADNPYRVADEDAKSVHLYFLADRPVEPDIARLKAQKSDTEAFELRDRVFYLHAPDGIGRSKLATNVERLLGVPATGRNWRTVQKVLAMASSQGPGSPGP